MTEKNGDPLNQLDTEPQPTHREILPSVFQISLPLPGKKPGPVKAYLFKGENNTLVDTGAVQSAGVLKRAVSELGCGFENLDQVILSHGHVDHYGAANRISQQTGNHVRIGVHPEDKRRVETGAEATRRTYFRFMRLMGVPWRFRLGLGMLNRVIRSMAEDCEVHFTFKDGDRLRLGNYEALVVGTPGHTRGSVCLYLEKENVLFSGDHILGHITPNAFVMLERDKAIPRRRSQDEYFDSIQKIEAIGPNQVWPAHGPDIDDLPYITDVYRRCFSTRQNKILSIMKEGPLTVYQIARRLFPEIGGKRLLLDLFLSISEVYTHLQELGVEGHVREQRERMGLVFSLQR